MSDAKQPGAILIVDNDPDEIFFIRRGITRLQILNPIFSILHGEDMITYLERRPPFDDRSKHPYPVLILTDLRMPGMDGAELLEWLRTHPEHSVPVCVISGSADPMTLAQVAEKGAGMVLTKPFNTEQFEQAVSALEVKLAYKSNS